IGLVLEQTQVSFVHERCRLQGLARPLTPQVARREPPQLLIDERQQRIERLPIFGHQLIRLIVTWFITTGLTGRSWRPVGTAPIFFTTSRPSTTSPNTLWRLSRCGVGPSVMKNWLPLVFGPALAIERTPARSCRRDGWNSSAKL